MFSFLNAGMLFLGLGAFLPLLIHLLAKRKPQKIVFSSVKFIKKSQEADKKKLNIKNLLLLLLRMAVIALVIFGIARPAVKGRGLPTGKNHPPTAAVFIIDNSYSMDYLVDTQTDFELALNKVETTNELFNNNDYTAFLTLEHNFFGSLHRGALPAGVLDNIRLTPNAKKVSEAIKEAEALLDGNHLANKEIYLFTDLNDDGSIYQPKYPLFIIPSTANESRLNLSLQNSQAVRDWVGATLGRKITFSVSNHNLQLSQDALVQLHLDDKKIAEKVIPLKPGQTVKDGFEAEVAQSGWHYGFVEVKNERAPYDDRSYFSFFEEKSPRILVAGKRLPPEAAAVISLYCKDNLSYTATVPQNITTGEILVISDGFVASEANLFNLEKYEQDGGRFIIFPSSESESLKPLLTAYFSAAVSGYDAQETNIDAQDNYNQIVKKALNKEQYPKISHRHLFTATQAKALLQAQNYPLLLENKGNYLWALDFSYPYNPFWLDPAFPVINVFIFDQLLHLEAPQFSLGCAYPAPSKTVVLPSGATLQLSQARFMPTQSGIYKFTDNDKTVNIAAVNIDYTDSDFKPLAANRLPAHVKILSAEKYTDQVLNARYGFEIWKILFLGACLCLGLEMGIILKEQKIKRETD